MVDLALLILLGIGAFWNGLYSPAQQLALTAALALLALWKGALTTQMKGGAPTMRMNGAPVVLTRLEAVALCFFAAGVALSMWSPAAAGAAAHGPALAAGWLLAWILGRQMAGDERIYRSLGQTFALLGTLMLFGGVSAISYLPPHHTGRLASFLGYPIALGILGLMGLAGTLPPLAEGRWWAPALTFGNCAAVLLSGSRGVWAVGLLLLGYLLWAAPGLIRPALVPALAALAAALWAGPAIALRQLAPALVPLLLGCMTLTLFERFPISRHRKWLWLGAGGLWLAAMAGAPGWGWFLGRATALPLTEGSSVERMLFLKDGLRLSLDLPLGAGYRAWNALHLQAASYGYYSAEVHSSPLDLALAFGWAGAAGSLLLFGRYLLGLTAGRRWSPERLTALAALAALGLHSLADWDLSYGLFAVLLWLGFGLVDPAAGPVAAPEWAGGEPPGAAGIRSPGEARVRLPMRFTALLSGLTLAATVVLGAGDLFEHLSERALSAGKAETAYRHATMATAVAPWNDLAWARAGLALRELGRPAEALVPLDRARALGPREPWYAALQARALMAAGRRTEAAAAWREYVRLWPWQVSAYEEALSAHLEMHLAAAVSGDILRADELAESGRAILAALDAQKAKEPQAAPRAPMQIETPIILQARDRFVSR